MGGPVSPILHGIGLIGLLWGISPFVSKFHLVLSGGLFVLQPAIFGYCLAGQADHHSLILALLNERIASQAPTNGGNSVWLPAKTHPSFELCQKISRGRNMVDFDKQLVVLKYIFHNHPS